MPETGWFRHDCDLHRHPKLHTIEPRHRLRAQAVYLGCLAVATQHLTNGWVSRADIGRVMNELDGSRFPQSVVRMLVDVGLLHQLDPGDELASICRACARAQKAELARFVAASLSERDSVLATKRLDPSRSQTLFLVHDYLEYQSPSSHRLVQREKARIRKQNQRERERHGVTGQESQRDTGGHGVTMSQRDERKGVTGGVTPHTATARSRTDQDLDLRTTEHPRAHEPTDEADALAPILDWPNVSASTRAAITHLASQITTSTYLELVHRVQDNRRAKNPIGLLRTLLEDQIRENTRTAAAAKATEAEDVDTRTPIQSLREADPHTWIEQVLIPACKDVPDTEFETELTKYVNALDPTKHDIDQIRHDARQQRTTVTA